MQLAKRIKALTEEAITETARRIKHDPSFLRWFLRCRRKRVHLGGKYACGLGQPRPLTLKLRPRSNRLTRRSKRRFCEVSKMSCLVVG